MNSYQHYSFGPTDTKICRLTFGRPVARDANDGFIIDTDRLESVVLAGGQPRVALATNKLTISCLGDMNGDNSFVQNDQFRREWVDVCTAFGLALQHTNLESVSIDMDHSIRLVQVAPGIVQMVVGDKSDWIISTILHPLRDIATLRSVHITTSSPLHRDFNQLELSLEAIASFANLESLVIRGFDTMSPESMTTLATALQTPTAFPALASLTLEPAANDDGYPQVGEECPPELVEPLSAMVEAIRTKDTLYKVLARSDWIDHSMDVKLQTFPSIYRAIQVSGLMPFPAPERRAGEDIRDLLLPPIGSPDPPTDVKWIRVMKNCISDIRDRLLLLLADGGSPNTPEDPTDALYKWISAMQQFVEDEDQFACFHFFFSKIDATKYINNPNLEAILRDESAKPDEITISVEPHYRYMWGVLLFYLLLMGSLVAATFACMLAPFYFWWSWSWSKL